jgi:hypothetical protein
MEDMLYQLFFCAGARPGREHLRSVANLRNFNRHVLNIKLIENELPDDERG